MQQIQDTKTSTAQMQALTILSQLSKAYGFSNLFSYSHEDDEGPSDIDEHGGKSDMKNGAMKAAKVGR